MDPTKLIDTWRADPVQFVLDNFGKGIKKIDHWQEEFLRSCASHNRVSATASKGVGKTAALSWLSWWFLTCHYKPNIAAVSNTIDNLRDGLWKEMSVWAAFSPLIKSEFVITKTQIFHKDHPLDWWMSARGYSKSADASQQADALAGLHADNMMFIIDEAGAVPDAVGAAAEAAIATEGGKKLYAICGNTNARTGPLWRANTSERDLWKNVIINGDPDNPNRSSRVSIEWARQFIAKYGRDSAFTKVNVFGEFPETSLNALIGDEDIRRSLFRRPEDEVIELSQKRIGVDVARFGDDRTVIQRRQGPMAYPPVELVGMRSNEVAARVAKEAVEWGAELIFVDDTGGYGSGVVDSLLLGGFNPIPVNFSEKPIDPGYLNKRAEMWFLMAEWVKKSGVLPSNDELARELVAPMYDYSNGKFKLESKEDIKSRLGSSPDIADALALTFALPEMPARRYSHELITKNAGKVKADYDPYSPERLK